MKSIKTTNLVLDIDLVWDSGIRNKNFTAPDDSDFKITDGIWSIPKGTEWDGTTHVPDGPEDPNKPGYPITWKSSLIHDLGCKYWHYKCFPYGRAKVDKFFFKLMKEAKFEYRWLYYCGVRCWGIVLEVGGMLGIVKKRKC